MNYNKNKHWTYSCKYHIVFCPKYRRKVLVDQISVRLKEIIYEVIEESKSVLIEMEIMSDHVHILCEVDPLYGVNKVIRYIKGRSSRRLREEFPNLKSRLPSLWTNSTFVSTVGGAPLSTIKTYIENQKNK